MRCKSMFPISNFGTLPRTHGGRLVAPAAAGSGRGVRRRAGGAGGAVRSRERSGSVTRRRVIGLALLACAWASSAGARLRDDLRGEQLYSRECASCHGPTGRGDGPEAPYFEPPPRNLHEGFLALYETDELIARIRSGQALEIDIDRPALRRRTRMVDDIVAHLERLPDLPWDEIERGSEVYAERCEGCHGPYGRPGADADVAELKPSRDLSDPAFQKSTDDARLLALAQHRRDGLPPLRPFAREADARAVLAYLRLLSPGFQAYSVWCAGCHGDAGHGDGELATGPDRPDVDFDRAYLRAQDPQQLRRQVVHMLELQEGAMPHLQHRLSDDQVRTVIDYLRAIDQSPRPSPDGR